MAKINEFKTQKRNANRHKERGMKALDRSIEQDGWIGAITTAADGETFDGSARLETVRAHFGEGVNPIVIEIDGTQPVILKRLDIANANDPKAQRLALSANKIAELNLDWDADLLAELNREIDLTGLWTEDEIAELLAGAKSGEGGEEDEEEVSDLIDEAESGKIESRVSLGQIWKLGRHTIACGDSTSESNVKKLLGDRFKDVGMVWADPPYGISAVDEKTGQTGGLGRTGKYGYSFGGSKSDSKPIKNKKYAPIAGDNTLDAAINSSTLSLELFQKSMQIWWGANNYSANLPNSNCWLIWDKQTDALFADAEIAWTNKSGAIRLFTHKWSGVCKASEHGQKRVHPTQKPIALCEWCFEKYGKPDDLIFDPFLGSAPSIIAAQQMEGDRAVFGFELSPDYVEVILRRFESFTGQTAELVGTL